MVKLSKRTKIYLDSDLHMLLKFKALETDRSISDLVNDAVRHELAEDLEDLIDIEKTAKEKTISYEELLRELKVGGKISKDRNAYCLIFVR